MSPLISSQRVYERDGRWHNLEERLFGFYYPKTGACDEEKSYHASMPPILDLVLAGVTTTADDHLHTYIKGQSMGFWQPRVTAGSVAAWRGSH
ncbi:MAG: hypothetical protein Ct9H300mP4_01750 [Gammaproteobacteria bacterium]|nr:MAG: hypothetical protein Ct9H300mP4_01750 [Gammaproteobacteria bacterium]